MEITVKKESGVSIVALAGRLDLVTGANLKEEIRKLCEQGPNRIHLNLKKIEFINSSGLGALVSVMKQVRLKKGRLTLSDLAPYVREIFDITQLSNVFEIHDTQQEALVSTEKVAVE